MKGIVTVSVKEIRDSLRDRRTLLNSLLTGPILGPLLFVGIVTLAMEKEVEKAEETLELPIVGVEHAPNLVAHLRQEGVVVEPPPEDAEAAVEAERHDVVLRVPEGYGADWTNGRPAPVELIADHSRREIDTTLDRIKRVIDGYSRMIGATRIQVRGVDPRLMQAIVVRDIDLSTPESRGALTLGILPYFLMLTLFIGGMPIAIDATAGEKERRSLEPLLINPLPRWHFMAGKLLATVVFILVSLMLALAAFVVSIGLIPADRLNVELNLDWAIAAVIFGYTAPFSLIAAVLLTTLAAFAKSFREAQSYMSVVVLVPVVPILWLMINPVSPEQWMMWIPVLSQSVLILETLSGEPISPLLLSISIGSTLGIGVVLAGVAARLYNRPRLVFSGG